MTDSPSLDNGVMIMIDTETLGLGPNAVIWQAAFMAVPLDDPDTRLKFDSFAFPVDPQIKAGREVNGSTLGWLLKQEDKVRNDFTESIDGDTDTLVALVRSMIRKITHVMESTKGPVEIWARGPQFDIVKLETLFELCGESAPWSYDQIRDLRTYMKVNGVASEDVDSSDIVPHVALEDCRFQIRCYQETARRVMSRS